VEHARCPTILPGLRCSTPPICIGAQAFQGARDPTPTGSNVIAQRESLGDLEALSLPVPLEGHVRPERGIKRHLARGPAHREAPGFLDTSIHDLSANMGQAGKTYTIRRNGEHQAEAKQTHPSGPHAAQPPASSRALLCPGPAHVRRRNGGSYGVV
jgi:hypothetical protein